MTNNPIMKVSRRAVIASTFAAIAAPSIIIPGKARGAQRLVIANWGGTGGIAQKKCYWDPFTAATGIEVISAQGPDLAKIRAQVQSRDVEWDLVNLADSWVAPGEKLGLYERIDTSIVPMERIVPAARREYMMGTYFYSGVLAFSSTRFKEGQRPRNWADYWNVEKFPGRRGLRNRIGETLEIALLADGVKPSEIYPCDVERAFKSLDRIKPHIRHWISQTPQTVQLIQNNECDFTYTYCNQVFGARQSGIDIGLSPDNQLIAPNWIAAIKGTRNKDAAMRYMEFATRPEPQIAFANMIANSPVSPGLLDKVDPSVKPFLPDVDNPTNVFMGTDWWGDHYDELTKRFTEWLMN